MGLWDKCGSMEPLWYHDVSVMGPLGCYGALWGDPTSFGIMGLWGHSGHGTSMGPLWDMGPLWIHYGTTMVWDHYGTIVGLWDHGLKMGNGITMGL